MLLVRAEKIITTTTRVATKRTNEIRKKNWRDETI